MSRFDVDDFVAACTEALDESDPTRAVKEAFERAFGDLGGIVTALGEPKRGALNALHRSPELTVLQIIWSPNVFLFPHDHRMWAVSGIYGGAEDNTFYRRTGSTIEVSGGSALREGDIGILGERAIHSVTNPSSRYTAAIHVYGGDFFATPRSQWDPDTLVEEPFDVDDVRRVLAEADEHVDR